MNDTLGNNPRIRTYGPPDLEIFKVPRYELESIKKEQGHTPHSFSIMLAGAAISIPLFASLTAGEHDPFWRALFYMVAYG